MNVKTAVLLFLTFLNIVFGLLVYSKNKKSPINITYSMFMSMVGLWSFGLAMFYFEPAAKYGVFWSNYLYFMGSSIAVAFFYVSLVPSDEIFTRKNFAVWPLLSLIVLFVLYFFTPFMIRGVIYPNGVKTFTYGPAHLLFDIHFSSLFIWAICRLFIALKYTAGIKREQIKYVLLSTFLGVAFNGITNVIMPSIFHNCSLVGIGPYITFIMVCIMTYAIVRYKILDINIVIKGSIVNTAIAVVLTVMLFLVYSTTQGNILKSLLTFSIMFLTALFLPKIKQNTETAVNQMLYKKKYDYQTNLEHFIEKMAFIPKEEDLFKNTAEILTEALGIKEVSVFIHDPSTGDYLLKYKTGMAQKEELKIHATDKLIEWLKTNKEVFVKEEMEKALSPGDIKPIEDILGKLSASVCVPILLESDLLGLIALGEKSSGEMYSHTDSEILRHFGTQFAVALNYKSIEAKLREEQNLANIGIMSMEISHEMRNLLQSPQTFIDLAPDRKDDVDFMTNFRGMALDRMKVVSDKLFDIMYFGKDRPLMLKPDVDINAIIDSNLLANEYIIKQGKIEISKEYTNIPKIMADKSQMTHILNNLIINAIDAMKGRTGKIRLRTKLHTEISDEMKQTSDNWIRIEVKDDGEGIPDDVLQKLFTPFVTTKSMGGLKRQGTGLGLAVVKKAVIAHHGYIYIHSKQGKGTTMIVDLPVTQKIAIPNIGFSEDVKYFG